MVAKIMVNQLTSAAKSRAGDDAASVASAASKGSTSKAASSKQVKQALAFMQAFHMMGNLGCFLSDNSKDDESTGVCGALIGHLSPMAGVNFLAPKVNPTEPEMPSLKLPKAVQERVVLEWWMLYLDSCTTYHSAYVKWLMSDVHFVNTVLHGNCNAGVTSTNEKGTYGLWEFWLNSQGIANLLSTPQLERDGYEIDYNTKREWVVTTPSGESIVFKRDTGVCAGMPYINMCEHHEGFAMIETVHKNFKGFTRKQVKDAILTRDEQAMVAYIRPTRSSNRW